MNRSLRRAASAVMIAGLVSCGETGPVGVSPVEQLGLGSLLSRVTLLVCPPATPDSVTQTIGPEGGVLRVGAHVLAVPPEALPTAVSITGVVPADPYAVVRFAPHGLAFEKPVQLTLGYAGCDLVGLLFHRRIAYTNDVLEILDVLPSQDDRGAREVTANLRHFSSYAVAW